MFFQTIIRTIFFFFRRPSEDAENDQEKCTLSEVPQETADVEESLEESLPVFCVTPVNDDEVVSDVTLEPISELAPFNHDVYAQAYSEICSGIAAFHGNFESSFRLNIVESVPTIYASEDPEAVVIIVQNVGPFEMVTISMDHLMKLSGVKDLPSQKITWDVEKNTIDYDLEALCLCGNSECDLKFGSDPKMDMETWFMDNELDTDEQKKRNNEQKRKHFEREAEGMRRTIKALEMQKKMEEEGLEEIEYAEEDYPKPAMSDPMSLKAQPRRGTWQKIFPFTLWSGVPFHRMSREELVKSQVELKKLIVRNRQKAQNEWLFASQFTGFGEVRRVEGGIIDLLMKDAERTEQKLLHFEMMLETVQTIQQCCFTF